MSENAVTIAYFTWLVHARQRAAVMEPFVLATQPTRTCDRFTCGASDPALRMRDSGMALSFGLGYWHTPRADAIFLHRKPGGLYLLAARLRAKVDIRAILEYQLAPEFTSATV